MQEGRSKGYVRFYRQIEENAFLMHDDTAYIVFTKLLIFVGRDKGSWAGGRRQLAKRLLMNDNTLYKALKRLERQQLIVVTSNRKYSIISICNWHKYQNVPNRLKLDVVTAPVTTRQPHGNTLTRTKEINNKPRPSNFVIKKATKNQPMETASQAKIDSIRDVLTKKGILKPKAVT